MKIALPITEDGMFSAHYGDCHGLAFFSLDPEGLFAGPVRVDPPRGTPCSWPDWIADQGVDVVLAGGMGSGARERLAARGVQVVTGVAAAPVDELVRNFVAGSLLVGANACAGDHDHDHDHDHGSCGCGH